MKFTNVLVIAALFAAISVDAIKITTAGKDDDDEKDPDADAKQPKKIDPAALPAQLNEAAAHEAAEKAKADRAISLQKDMKAAEERREAKKAAEEARKEAEEKEKEVHLEAVIKSRKAVSKAAVAASKAEEAKEQAAATQWA